MSLRSWWNEKQAEAKKRSELKSKYFKLKKSIEAKDIQAVSDLLDDGAHPNFNPDSLRFPWPAQLALESGETKILQNLLDRGMNPNFMFTEEDTFNRAWQSLLYAAIDRGQEDMAMALLKHPKLDIKASGMAVSIEHTKMFPSPLERARKQGMDRVVRTLAKLEAAMKRKEADELDKEVRSTAQRLARQKLAI